jgi:hypothetical protein
MSYFFYLTVDIDKNSEDITNPTKSQGRSQVLRKGKLFVTEIEICWNGRKLKLVTEYVKLKGIWEVNLCET